jgi:hypothetical protein
LGEPASKFLGACQQVACASQLVEDVFEGLLAAALL